MTASPSPSTGPDRDMWSSPVRSQDWTGRTEGSSGDILLSQVLDAPPQMDTTTTSEIMSSPYPSSRRPQYSAFTRPTIRHRIYPTLDQPDFCTPDFPLPLTPSPFQQGPTESPRQCQLKGLDAKKIVIGFSKTGCLSAPKALMPRMRWSSAEAALLHHDSQLFPNHRTPAAAFPPQYSAIFNHRPLLAAVLPQFSAISNYQPPFAAFPSQSSAISNRRPLFAAFLPQFSAISNHRPPFCNGEQGRDS
ncbi:hypothetical protein BZA77DRAFT_350684 [Pyronema omphalodes]|nr:hypothetical protein BZA77DRAFT_350684 [Pyronema omphalodes]